MPVRLRAVTLLVLAPVLVLAGGCRRNAPPPPDDGGDASRYRDATATLPSRFKTAAEVPVPDFSSAGQASDFLHAVDEAASLLNASPRPLRTRADRGEDTVIEGAVAFEVSEDCRKAVLPDAHARFLARGYSLVLQDQGFGYDGAPDEVALLPTADRYEVMAAMATNGDNYEIGTAGIIAWMRELEAEQPHVLTGIGFDWMQGRFTEPVRDADALAKRMYDFCPDIVDQGVGSVEELAKELKSSNELYFWWD